MHTKSLCSAPLIKVTEDYDLVNVFCCKLKSDYNYNNWSVVITNWTQNKVTKEKYKTGSEQIYGG